MTEYIRLTEKGRKMAQALVPPGIFLNNYQAAVVLVARTAYEQGNKTEEEYNSIVLEVLTNPNNSNTPVMN